MHACERVELRGCDLAGVRGAEALRGARMTWNDVIENAALFATALGIEVVDYALRVVVVRIGSMILYENAASGNCYKVRLLLAHLGLAYERRSVDVIDRSNRPELLGGLNPALRVPTIVLDDGRSLGESGAILWYFGEGTRFVPDDRYERAQVLQWMFFEQYDHEPAIAVARFWLALSGDPDAYADRLPEKQAAGYRALDAMERHLDGTDVARRRLRCRSPTSRCTRTRTSPTRAASTSAGIRRFAPGSTASPQSRGTCRSTPSGSRRGGREPLCDELSQFCDRARFPRVARSRSSVGA